MAELRLSVVEALGGGELPVAAGRGSSRDPARLDGAVRTLLVVLDQFEDYFLYHPDEDGEGTSR